MIKPLRDNRGFGWFDLTKLSQCVKPLGLWGSHRDVTTPICSIQGHCSLLGRQFLGRAPKSSSVDKPNCARGQLPQRNTTLARDEQPNDGHGALTGLTLSRSRL